MPSESKFAKPLPGGYHAPTIARFESARVAAGHTKTYGAHEAFLEELLDAHAERSNPNVKVGDVYSALAFTEEQARALETLLASTGMTRTDFLRRLLLREIDAHHRRTTRLHDLDLSDPENRSRRAGAGYQYLRQVVDRLMAQNMQASDENDRVYITTENLAKITGSQMPLIRHFLRDHASLLQEHHEVMGWLTAEAGHQHNYRVGIRKREQARKARKQARQGDAVLADMGDGMSEELD